MKTQKQKNVLFTIITIVVVTGILVVTFWPKEKTKPSSSDDSVAKQQEFESVYKPFTGDLCNIFSFSNKFYGIENEFKVIEIKKGTRVSVDYMEKRYAGIVPETGWFFQNSKGIFGTSGKIVEVEKFEVKDIFKVKEFPLLWTVEEATPLLKKYPLTCRDDDRLPIETYEGFLQLKEAYSCFKEVLFDKETAPSLLFTDEKGEIFLLNKEGKCWLTREQSHNKHGWKYDPNSTAFYGR